MDMGVSLKEFSDTTEHSNQCCSGGASGSIGKLVRHIKMRRETVSSRSEKLSDDKSLSKTRQDRYYRYRSKVGRRFWIGEFWDGMNDCSLPLCWDRSMFKRQIDEMG